MRRASIILYMLFEIAGANHAFASPDAVPDEKPIELLKQQQFMEGVDVPPAKPNLPEVQQTDEVREAEGQREISSANGGKDCEIPGALIAEPSGVDDRNGNDPQCRVENPVGLAGVVLGSDAARFPAPLEISCEFAKTLTAWLRKDVLPAAKDQFDSSISVLASGPGYQCRRRNNQPDGKMSEHAFGKAVDISNFQLANGSNISVEDDWGRDTKNGRFLKTIHALACRRFTTVLGPDADPNHRSHFHVDIGCHGKTCTYLICQ